MKALDLTGQIFGRLTVLTPTYKGNQRAWNCSCKCGNLTVVRTNDLVTKKVSSCKCLHKELLSASMQKHGQSGKTGKRTSEYSIWSEMKSRCYRITCKAFTRYGARGIKVCDRWLESFENFFEDMGPRPSVYHSLERVENNGNYEPSNCKWAIKEEQANNTRTNFYLNYNGTVKTMAQWARYWNMPYNEFRSLIYKHIKTLAHDIKPSTPVPAGKQVYSSIEGKGLRPVQDIPTGRETPDG